MISTPDPAGGPTYLERVRAALDWYATTGHVDPDPTTGTGAIRLLEAELRARFAVAGCLVVSSATSAILIALQSSGVGPGDDVVIPADAWGASRAAVTTLGANMIVAPTTADRRVVSVSSVMERLTASTRAVVVTHYGENRAPTSELTELLPASVSLIEDAAAAGASTFQRAEIGNVGRFVCLSFGPGKAIDAGGGGAVLVRDRADLGSAIELSQHPARQKLFGITMPVEALNHRIHPVSAVVALHALSQ